MSDTNDLVEQMARAIRRADVDFFEQEGSPPLIASELDNEGAIEFTEALTDAVLAVADPIIRANERERLAQKAEEHGYWVMSHSPGVQTKRASIWLRAQE